MSNYSQQSESISRYFKSIKNLNPLTKEEELELATRAKSGDDSALNKLIKHNLKIVVTIANKNVGRGIQVDDLIQQGNLGLIDAAHRFDPTVNVRFATFAATRVLKNINQLIDTCGRIVRIPVNQECQRYRDIKNGNDISNLSSVQLDDFTNERNSNIYASIGSIIPSIDTVFEHEHFKIKVTSLLNKLKDRDKKVVKLYFGIDELESMETKEIANIIGLTQIRVCQIINSSIKKMKEHMVTTE